MSGKDEREEPHGSSDGCSDWDEWLVEFDHFLTDMLNSAERKPTWDCSMQKCHLIYVNSNVNVTAVFVYLFI